MFLSVTNIFLQLSFVRVYPIVNLSEFSQRDKNNPPAVFSSLSWCEGKLKLDSCDTRVCSCVRLVLKVDSLWDSELPKTTRVNNTFQGYTNLRLFFLFDVCLCGLWTRVGFRTFLIPAFPKKHELEENHTFLDENMQGILTVFISFFFLKSCQQGARKHRPSASCHPASQREASADLFKKRDDVKKWDNEAQVENNWNYP